MTGTGYRREVKAIVRFEVIRVVTDMTPSSGKGVRYGCVFGSGGIVGSWWVCFITNLQDIKDCNILQYCDLKLYSDISSMCQLEMN